MIHPPVKINVLFENAFFGFWLPPDMFQQVSKVITNSDNNSELKVKKLKIIILGFQTNPTTLTRWQIMILW